MTLEELRSYIDAAGGKKAFAARMKISVRYVDMLLGGDRKMSDQLEELIRLKFPGAG